MVSKMINTVVNRLRRDETGQAFILVLILLLLGGLMIGPLLGFMGTGLKAGQAYEQRMAEVYAADAGIEDAIWKIKNGLVPDEGLEYPLAVNGKDVWVKIPPEPREDPMIAFFNHIGVLEGTQGDINKKRPQAAWLVIYNPILSSTEPDTYDTYRITGYYSSTQPRDILSTGFWIAGYDGSTEVIEWDSADYTLDIDLNVDGDTEDEGEQDIPTKPLIEDYPNYDFRTVDYLGTAFVWEWGIGEGPPFGQGAEGQGQSAEDVFCRTQRFRLDPALSISDSGFPPNVAWLRTKQNSIHISWSGELITGIEGIMAEATSATGKSTTVLSYVFAEQTIPGGPVAITIMTWEADLQ